MKRTLLGLIALTTLFVGCAELDEANEALETFEETPATIEIETSGPKVCWTATIDMSSKQGCGNKSYEVTESITVANAQKKGTAGKLTMRLVMEGEVVDEKSTSADYGIVQVSE